MRCFIKKNLFYVLFKNKYIRGILGAEDIAGKKQGKLIWYGHVNRQTNIKRKA